jgi:hypothetical protein
MITRLDPYFTLDPDSGIYRFLFFDNGARDSNVLIQELK